MPCDVDVSCSAVYWSEVHLAYTPCPSREANMPLGLQDRVAHLVALEPQARVALY